ncbi:alpha/beta hydrolase [Cnuibacter physcomitrellae]|uniref:alpha/beta hydrolase n=1 Tax=Cnuibacter physcomitrellae TaxID=1619308 RepID=UPI0021758F36|nr:alpha/beta hydrolase [Cnuibacter physcomitrellae]MCS5495867.1 alpha/beta hydrolase [Cnuibacter physcomitrellae]
MEALSVPGPAGDIPLRLYHPERSTPPRPGLLWVHGGGFSGGSVDMPEADVVARELADRAGALVVTVDYRLAGPDTRFPAGLDDVQAAWSWFTDRVDDYGVDRSRLQLGGCSAGGNLAVAAARREVDAGRPGPAGLLLGYPALHFPTPAVEGLRVDELPEILRFTADHMLGVLEGYLGRIHDIPVEAMPGLGSVEGLPPTRLELSGIDELRGSGELFARQLRSVGVPVVTDIADGLPHGHLNIPPVPALPEIDRSLARLAEALRSGPSA